MKLIMLHFADELTTTREGKTYLFKKGAPVEVEDSLADKLLGTGEFMLILGDLSIVPVVTPEPLKPTRKKKSGCKNCEEK